MRRHEPAATCGVRAAAKTEEYDNRHRHSYPYSRESEDVERGIATVTPGTVSYTGGSRTGAITTGTATYMGGSQAMSCHHRYSSLEGRETEQKSARPDSHTGATAMMTDDDQQREASDTSKCEKLQGNRRKRRHRT